MALGVAGTTRMAGTGTGLGWVVRTRTVRPCAFPPSLHFNRQLATQTTAHSSRSSSRSWIIGAGVVSVVVTGSQLWRYDQPVSCEEETTRVTIDLPSTDVSPGNAGPPRFGEEKVWLWGSNKYGLVTPNTAATTSVRLPMSSKFFRENVALRDLKLNEQYGVVVDARGDLYQWGLGFEQSNGGPSKTLAGKDIVQVETTDDKIYALSRKGKLYSIDAMKSQQIPEDSRWWHLGWFTRTLKHDELSPKGETFAKIAAGKDHLLTLSKKGQVWAASLSSQVNDQGQLGMSRPAPGSLHPIPSLESIQVRDIAAGSYHSLCSTADGRLMVFGSNTYGQLFLGTAGTSIDRIVQPLEVSLGTGILGKGGQGKVVQVEAGGSTSYLVLEKKDSAGKEYVDIVSAGRGQFGGLGSGSWSMMGGPSRVKSLSSLVEFSEHHQAIRPIGIHSISAGESHVAAVLDNHSDVHSEQKGDGQSSGPVWGRDVYLWGHNFDGQLGNGRRSNSALPQHLPPLHRSGPTKAVNQEDAGAGVSATLSAGTPSPMPHSRCQLYPPTRREVFDMSGRRQGKKMVEQVVYCGNGTSAIYTKIVG